MKKTSQLPLKPLMKNAIVPVSEKHSLPRQCEGLTVLLEDSSDISRTEEEKIKI